MRSFNALAKYFATKSMTANTNNTTIYNIIFHELQKVEYTIYIQSSCFLERSEQKAQIPPGSVSIFRFTGRGAISRCLAQLVERSLCISSHDQSGSPFIWKARDQFPHMTDNHVLTFELYLAAPLRSNGGRLCFATVYLFICYFFSTFVLRNYPSVVVVVLKIL